MAQVNAVAESTENQFPPRAGDRTLRIVVFGMPDAGKTSLLAALAQAADSPNNGLQGELVDTTGELDALRRRVNKDEPLRTEAEVVGYPITFTPNTDGENRRPVQAILYDCDGRVANEYISQQKTLHDSAGSELAKSVLQADTLILAVDISASSDVLNRNFGQFVKFLRLLEHSRSRQSEVNGLPVYLVLTKCDLLARSDDTFMNWIDRIEERKRKVHEEFRNHLAKLSKKSEQPFGKIDMHVWATAKQRPELGSAAAASNEPYQVAELFRQCLQSAAEFHSHRKKAHRRLLFTLFGVAGLAGIMVLLALFFLWGRTGVGPELLSQRIRSQFSTYDTSSAERLDKAEFHLKWLQRIKENEAFDAVPRDQRKMVDDEIDQLEAYRNYANDIDNLIKKNGMPSEINEEHVLQRMKDQLAQLSPPKGYVDEWTKSGQVHRQQNLIDDVKAIEKTLTTAKEKYRSVINRGKKADELRALGDFNKAIPMARTILADAKSLPEHKYAADDLIPNSSRVTWTTIFGFNSMRQLFLDWQRTEPGVKKLAMIAVP